MSERQDRCKKALTFAWKSTSDVLAEIGDGRDTLDAVRQNLDAIVRDGFAEKRTVMNGPKHEAQYRIKDALPFGNDEVQSSKADRLRGRLTDEWQPTKALIRGGDDLTHQDLHRLLNRGEVERRTAIALNRRGSRIVISEWRRKPREVSE